ncbi:hypothetical protein Rhopal_005736-T1 [Rhodotorula paludigena]|uniref:Uncharacterized protein n=1 Tax=Rhodotorula paludigena TaxID=86838 RepID=A0AAV5GJA2_9BASI|nr:hypothetical protein Rhopal_005736-T1 [Rhodotorula paludigena]
MAHTCSPDLATLYATLGQLRLALPLVLLGLVAARWAAEALLGMMDRIQSAGWQVEDDVYGPPERDEAAERRKRDRGGDEEDEDDVTPVVTKSKTVRRGLVLGTTGLVAFSYFGDGVAQVVATLITLRYTPDDPLYENLEWYSPGGLAAFALLGLGLFYEARRSDKSGAVGESPWPTTHPRVISFVALCLEAATLGVYGRILATDSSIDPKADALPFIHLALLSSRVLLIVALLAFQFRPFYRATFFPASGVPPSERTSLLGSSTSASNGYSAIPTAASTPSVLRGTRIPSNRPPDPKSLSVLTLFHRVKLLFPYLWPSRSIVLQVIALVCFGLMLLKRYLNVARPIFFGRIISDLSAGRPPYVSVGLYCLVAFLSDSNSMLYQYLWLPIEQYSEREMALLAFDTLLNLSQVPSPVATGELLRILSRSEAINDFFELLIFSFIPILIDLPVAFVVLWVKYGLAVVAVVTVVSVIYVATSITLAESRTKLYRQLRDESQYMHQLKTDTLFGFEVVKYFTAESFEARRLRDAMWRYQRGYFRVYSAWNSLSLLQNGISNFGILVVSFMLAHRVVTGEMDVGLFATFISYYGQLLSPLNQISSLYRRVMSNAVDTEQLIELLNETREIQDKTDPVELEIDPLEGAEIEFDDLRFSYDGKVDVLKGVSLRVPRGKSVALVGPSGGGKSTITRLLYRFYDVSGGAIRINGHDVRDLSQRSLRAAIGLVPQDSVLFNSSVRFNIAYGGLSRLNAEGKAEEGKDLAMDEIVEAAKSAAMHDRVMSFPDQYETLVGERGMRLSGGEKQRIAIARTILKNPPILVLDEATSALDTHNERLIQTRLRELSQGRTSLIIAHRLSTIVDADLICVLKDGQIVEQGSHNELLQIEGGVYAELWQKQIEGQDSTLPSAAPSGTQTPVPQAAAPAAAAPPTPADAVAEAPVPSGEVSAASAATADTIAARTGADEQAVPTPGPTAPVPGEKVPTAANTGSTSNAEAAATGAPAKNGKGGRGKKRGGGKRK